MQLAMESVNEWNWRNGLPELEMGIALNTGNVVVGNIGSQKRSKYGVVGRNVNLTARVESNTVGNQVLITENTLKQGGDVLQIGKRMDLLVKGVEGLLPVYELLGVEGDYGLHMPDIKVELFDLEQAIPVSYSVLEGKQIDVETVEAKLAKLGKKDALIHSESRLPPLTNIKLKLQPPDTSEKFEDVYAKVLDLPTEGPDLFHIRFTSVPPEVAGFIEKRISNR
jgi:adenylate cyclase